jgi:hypothetical protein
MKTKIFLLVCLFMGLIWTNANAQGKSNNARQGWFASEYWAPIECDGVVVDYLEGGELTVHYVARNFKNGKIYKEIDQLKGKVTSLTGETFTIRETDKWSITDGVYITCRYNLIGNMGTHYHGVLIFNFYTGEITIGKTVCN